ncbi:lasso peptide isopeptide bond-forming cyclase [Bailinhaonella thermotolerans]|uniref:lasso peptide isopeptide bond-forming cyclase n=1 Tax=Bailinhaonella thermotolerans TaxID=1070861 RepID=UPI001F5BA295|nr:lasso peptide isopeptide bond-forming cyclase [Bailinhaonella thermotolerans]
MLSRPGHGGAYFAVLPDRAPGPAVATVLSGPDTRVLRHPSGRPWLVGRWPDDEIAVAEAGDARLAVIGRCPAAAGRLAAEAARLRDLAALDALALTLPGCFHLVAALGGRCRVQGTASGLRLVFHALVDGLAVAADRADVLAAAIGAGLDERQVAVRLLWPVPHPLGRTPLWHGVTAVDPGHHLLVERDGRTTRHRRWWAPPEPVRTLAEAAPGVRAALDEAVAVRTRGGGTVSLDLSGGLDSTSLCFLAAARREARLIASTWPGRDPADDDLEWARRAAARLPGVEHVVWPPEESPLVYAGLLEIDDTLDEPTIGVMDRARVLAHAPRLAAMGSRLHVTGIGGDHVAWCSEAAYHGLLRRRPLWALGRLRGFRALFHWPAGPMARALADSRPYRRWLVDSAADLRAPLPPPVTGALGWGAPPRLFGWVTAEAVRLAAEAISEAAAGAEPLAPDRGAHADLHSIHDCSRVIRQWEQASARAGLPLTSPYLDDRVIEACLSVRPGDRVSPWRYKPLLAAAMRDVVPGECLRRATKAAAALDAADGLRRHAPDLRVLWEDSRLARLGLVDPAPLRDLAGRPDAPELRQAVLYSTIGCEVWLRTLEHAGKEAAR